MRLSRPVLIIVSVSLALSFYFYLTTPPKVKKKVEVQPSISSPTQVPKKAFTYEQKKWEDKIGWGRDPFLVPKDFLRAKMEEKKEERPKVRLYAIVEGKKGKMAIIGEEVVTKGEKIKTGEKVIEITKDGVVLQLEDSKRTINLEKD